MCAEHAAGDGASLEQAEAEQHGIAHAPPYRADGVAACGDALFQHRIGGTTVEDYLPLRLFFVAQGKEVMQIQI